MQRLPRRPLVLLSLLALGAGCGPAVSISEEEARAVLEPALADVETADRVGLHLKGKAVWLQAPFFDKSCLEQKDLAFNDDPGSRPGGGGGGIARISPTYEAQRYLTASTETGYCLYAGKGLSTEIKEAEFDWGTQDRWRFTVAYSMAEPTPWFECLDPKVKERVIIVKQGEGEDAAPVVEGSVALVEGECPGPLPGGETREAARKPTQKPPGTPSEADVIGALKRLDDALWEGDFLAARDAIVCYNLFEEDKVGTCSVGEVIAMGPVSRGEARMQDGTPWLEYVADAYEDVGRISRDRKDPTMFHARYKHKRTGKERSVSVQWADGQWKVVGIVGKKAEAITTARILNDLHERDKAEIFQRRLAGEMIDEQGEWLPGHEPEEE